MDYTHSPYLIYLIGGLGALLGVVFVVGTVLALRRPRHLDADPGPDGPPEDPGPP